MREAEQVQVEESAAVRVFSALLQNAASLSDSEWIIYGISYNE